MYLTACMTNAYIGIFQMNKCISHLLCFYSVLEGKNLSKSTNFNDITCEDCFLKEDLKIQDFLLNSIPPVYVSESGLSAGYDKKVRMIAAMVQSKFFVTP